MFDDLQKLLKNLESGQHSIAIPIETDDKGYVDKECPNNDCKFQFKVNDDDWEKYKKDEMAEIEEYRKKRSL